MGQALKTTNFLIKSLWNSWWTQRLITSSKNQSSCKNCNYACLTLWCSLKWAKATLKLHSWCRPWLRALTLLHSLEWIPNNPLNKPPSLLSLSPSHSLRRNPKPSLSRWLPDSNSNKKETNNSRTGTSKRQSSTLIRPSPLILTKLYSRTTRQRLWLNLVSFNKQWKWWNRCLPWFKMARWNPMRKKQKCLLAKPQFCLRWVTSTSLWNGTKIVCCRTEIEEWKRISKTHRRSKNSRRSSSTSTLKLASKSIKRAMLCLNKENSLRLSESMRTQ